MLHRFAQSPIASTHRYRASGLGLHCSDTRDLWEVRRIRPNARPRERVSERVLIHHAVPVNARLIDVAHDVLVDRPEELGSLHGFLEVVIEPIKDVKLRLREHGTDVVPEMQKHDKTSTRARSVDQPVGVVL